MRKLLCRVAGLLMSMCLVNGCASSGQMRGTHNGATAACGGYSTKTIIGGVAGGALGGLAANKLSNGNLAITALGAIIGGVAGAAAGNALDVNDCLAANAALNQMETAQAGEAIGWQNPANGDHGVFVAGGQTLARDGQPCRNYTRQITTQGGTSQPESGLVCRTTSGDWEAVG